MEQMLLLSFTEKRPAKSAIMNNEREDMKVVMRQMKRFLGEAANDLLQPRPQAVQQLLALAKK
jgi:hypothetical protein